MTSVVIILSIMNLTIALMNGYAAWRIMQNAKMNVEIAKENRRNALQ